MDSIQEMRRDLVTILLVEQNRQATPELADRHHVIKQGTLVYEGKGDEFRTDETVQQKYLSV